VTADVQTGIGRFGNLKAGELRKGLRRGSCPPSRRAQNDKRVIRNTGGTKKCGEKYPNCV
jgi:hypothetical protein